MTLQEELDYHKNMAIDYRKEINELREKLESRKIYGELQKAQQKLAYHRLLD